MIVRMLSGCLFGGMVGILLAVASALLWALVMTLWPPEDPSAGNGVIAFLFMAPGAMLLGALIGMYKSLSAGTLDDDEDESGRA